MAQMSSVSSEYKFPLLVSEAISKLAKETICVGQVKITSINTIKKYGFIDAIDKYLLQKADDGSSVVIIHKCAAKIILDKRLHNDVWDSIWKPDCMVTICDIYRAKGFEADIVASLCSDEQPDDIILADEVFGTYDPKTNIYDISKGFLNPGTCDRFNPLIRKKQIQNEFEDNTIIPTSLGELYGNDKRPILVKYGIRISW